MKYLTSMITDQGPRKQNQDSCYLQIVSQKEKQMVCAAVCDGLGGLSSGELASAELVRGLQSWGENYMEEFPEEGIPAGRLYDQWNQMVHLADDRLSSYAKNNHIELGSTATMVLFRQWEFVVYHVGDCRLYQINKDGILQLTVDHTVTQREVELGNLTKEQAENDSQQHILLQCIGMNLAINPDYFIYNTEPDAVYLLCCDGFRHKITTQEMKKLFDPEVNSTEEEMQKNLSKAVSLIRERGETDNATAILIRTVPEPDDIEMVDDTDETQTIVPGGEEEQQQTIQKLETVLLKQYCIVHTETAL